MYGDYYNPYNNYSSNNQWQNPIVALNIKKPHK